MWFKKQSREKDILKRINQIYQEPVQPSPPRKLKVTLTREGQYGYWAGDEYEDSPCDLVFGEVYTAIHYDTNAMWMLYEINGETYDRSRFTIIAEI